jgi:hypothetical protein
MQFFIVHDHTAHSSQHDHRMYLCDDNKFRDGFMFGCRGQTLAYKRLSAAMKKFAIVDMKKFPNACIVADDCGLTRNIHRVK